MALAAPLGVVLLLSPVPGAGSCAAPFVAPAGRYAQADMTALWLASGGSTATTHVAGIGPVSDPAIAGAVGMAESGGDAGVVNGIGAGGLMQIHPPEPGYLDPARNMRIAVRKFNDSLLASGNGWRPWEAFTGPDARGDDGPWRGYLDGSASAPTGAAAVCAPVGATLANLVAEADRMEALDRPYLWGGGHATFDPDGRWDCSGAISWLLHHLGLLDGAPLSSGGLMTWGESGRGEDFTVWTNPEHVFLVVERGPRKGQAFGTATVNRAGEPGSGPMWHRHGVSGFVARHYGAARSET